MIPLGAMVAVTGVSGSGKSTLVHDVLYKALETKRAGGSFKELCDRIEGDALINEVVLVDQSPIGRTPRSNPSTYLKAFDAIREVFAATPEAKKRGFSAGTFFLQHSRRPLRSLPGRRHGHRGDAVPRRRRAGLRGVPRHALQEQRARSALSRQKHSRSARR